MQQIGVNNFRFCDDGTNLLNFSYFTSGVGVSKVYRHKIIE